MVRHFHRNAASAALLTAALALSACGTSENQAEPSPSATSAPAPSPQLTQDQSAPAPKGFAFASGNLPFGEMVMPEYSYPEPFNPCEGITPEEFAAAGLPKPEAWPNGFDPAEYDLPSFKHCFLTFSPQSPPVGLMSLAGNIEDAQAVFTTDSGGSSKVLPNLLLQKEPGQMNQCAAIVQTTEGFFVASIADAERSTDLLCREASMVFEKLYLAHPMQ